jgi:hypothetical protein
MSAVEIRRELFAVYSQNLVNEGNIIQWNRVAQDEREMFAMESEVSFVLI